MKPLAAVLALALIAAVVAPAGSQQRPVIVRPEVQIHTSTVEPTEPPQEMRAFATTLVLSFAVEEEDQHGPAIEIRCATPEYRAVVTKQTGDFSRHLRVEGVIQPLRDGQALLLFEAEVGGGREQIHTVAEVKGSAILRESVETVLIKSEGTVLKVSYAPEPAE
jgi:hypothetical protein